MPSGQPETRSVIDFISLHMLSHVALRWGLRSNLIDGIQGRVRKVAGGFQARVHHTGREDLSVSQAQISSDFFYLMVYRNHQG